MIERVGGSLVSEKSLAHSHYQDRARDGSRGPWPLVLGKAVGLVTGTAFADYISLYHGRAVGGCWKVQQRRLAHVPHDYRSWLDSTSAPMGVQQELMRGRTAGADATRAGFDHHERVRKCLDDGQAGGQQQGGEDGIEERLGPCKTPTTLDKSPSDFATAVIWGYLGLARPLNGCGGRI